MKIAEGIRGLFGRIAAAGAGGALQGVAAAAEPQTADVARFALARVQYAPGHGLEIGAIFLGYCDYASKRGERALPRSGFETVWAAFCKETKLKTHKHGAKTFVENIKLAA